MPIIGLQIKLQERGRIRIGKQVETKGGKKAPRALDKFRFTSRDRSAVEGAAKAYGGKVEEWDNNGRKEWQVETDANSIPVLLPPSELGFSQWYELWSAGGCQRRCTGPDDVDNPRAEQWTDGPCICREESNSSIQCEPHTRLSVMLPDVPGFGLWMLVTTGINAAMEMLGAHNTLKLLSVNGQIVPGVLKLDQRSIKRPDEPVKRFVVPMIDFDVMAMMTAASSGQPALTPVPAKAAPPNIAEQMASVENIEPKRRRAAPIPATGVQPRTAAQAAKQDSTVTTSGGVGGTAQDFGPADAVAQATENARKVTENINKIEATRKHPEPSPDPTAVAENDVAANDNPEQGQGYDTPCPWCDGTHEGGAENCPENRPDNNPQINQHQLGKLGYLFDRVGTPYGEDIRIQWCEKTLGRKLGSPRELRENDAVVLIAKLTQLQRIRQAYDTDDYDLILDDLTEYLQLEIRLERIEYLSDEDITAIIEAIDMEKTGQKILGLNIPGGDNETTAETRPK